MNRLSRLLPDLLIARLGSARALVVALFLCTAAGAGAQSVAWDPPAGTLARGQTSELSLVFDNCAPENDTVELPAIPGLQLGRPSQSSQTSIVNMRMSQRVVLTYPVVPTASSGRIAIPEFEIATTKGKLRVGAAAYEVGEATVGRSNVPIERVAAAEIVAEPTSVWAGQVFSLRYQLLVSRRYNPTGVGPLDWTKPTALLADEWSKFENIERVVGGEPRVGLQTQTRALFKEPGTHPLPVAHQPVNLATGSPVFDFFGNRQNNEQYLITSTAPTLQVRPLPPSAPADFLKAVGQFTFTSKVVPITAAIGEPVTWTLVLEGTGNWPDGLALPAREVSRDFHAFQPNLQRKMKDGTLFEGTLTEDIVLMPTKAGTYTLGPLSYSYFDPVAGAYKTIRTPAVKVTVTAAAAPGAPTGGATAANPVFQFNPENAGEAATGSATVKSPAPELPGRMPLEPLPGAATAHRPWPRIGLGVLLAPVPVLFAFWLGLGWRRARLTDPRLPQRRALAALPAAVAAVADATDPNDRRVAVLRWQELAALAWRADHAAPPAELFAAAVAQEMVAAGPESVENWTRLWREAEAYLYRREPAPLPEDWAPRAAIVLRSARLRRHSWLAPFWPSNLWPAALALVLCLAALPRVEAAGGAEERYRGGEFANAEEAWRAGLSVTPDDWKLRHNLGLALAQQNRWSEAAAQWSAAFLAAPRDPSVRWHLALGLDRAEFTQPEFTALAGGLGLAAVARLASPAEWQYAVVAGATLLALAIGCSLAARHFPSRRRLRWIGMLTGAVGLVALFSGYTALHAYGRLAHPDAVLVWKATELRSVPTEAGEQKPEPLAAGTIALRVKGFLGWEQLRFANGQTGWTRRDGLQPLYPHEPR